jgi:hypothetical protein
MTNILDSISYDNLINIVVYFIHVFIIYIIIRLSYLAFNNIVVSKNNKENYKLSDKK